MDFEDGFIRNNLIVCRGKRDRLQVARGIELYGPAMESLSVASLQQLANELRVRLRAMSPQWRLQCRFSQHTDLQEPLLAYHDATREKAQNPFCARQRDELYSRLAQADLDGRISGSCCQLFVIVPLGGLHLLKRDKQLLKTTSKSLDVFFKEVERMMQRLGGHAKEMGDEDLFKTLYRAFNPGASHLNQSFLNERFQPGASILESCLEGNVVATENPVTGFYHGGQFHSCLVLSGLPQSTYAGMISLLTNADVRGFSFTVNLEGRDVTAEIEKAESNKAKLERARLSGSKHARLDHEIQAASERVQRLASGLVVPMRLQLIVHAFDQSQEGLQTKISALRNAMMSMSAARVYEMALPTSCRNFFFASLPGASHREKAYWHLVDDHTVANLLPICGDSPESLKNAEALYQS